MDTLVDFWNVAFVVVLVITAAVGVLALTSPKMFGAVTSLGNRTVFHGFQYGADQRRVDIDTFVVTHGRLFGVLVIATVAYLWVIARNGPEMYSKPFLLIIVTCAVLMGIIALRQIVQQSWEITRHQAQALTDPLTSLINRRALDAELSRRLAQQRRQGTPFCLMIVDVDRFKSFNDRFGHVRGDVILKKTAEVLGATVREMDIVARLGGDEFAVLLPGSNLDVASRGAERLRSAVCDSPLKHEDQEHALTVSIGLAEAQPDDDPASLIKRADSALYSAKEAGRNCCYEYGGPEPAIPQC
jgi:diguanylate cyclase (GGDEF)-like protein